MSLHAVVASTRKIKAKMSGKVRQVGAEYDPRQPSVLLLPYYGSAQTVSEPPRAV